MQDCQGVKQGILPSTQTITAKVTVRGTATWMSMAEIMIMNAHLWIRMEEAEVLTPLQTMFRTKQLIYFS